MYNVFPNGNEKKKIIIVLFELQLKVAVSGLLFPTSVFFLKEGYTAE